MYDHPGVLDAIDRVESWGVDVVDPRIEEGKAKIAAEDTIVTATARATTPSPLADRHVVVTSGATTESIDPIRTLSNRASGRTGRAIARACYVRGADVTLVHNGPDVHHADVRSVESVAEMLAAVKRAVRGDADDHAPADALISAAAIGDFTVETAAEKLRSGESLTLELEPTPKLLDRIRATAPDLPMIGFKAETEGDDDAMVSRARSLLDRADLDLVVANDASVMGNDRTRVLLVRDESVTPYEGSKAGLGSRVADGLVEILD
jgi:phosphopantothenoylcysteine decarboxylase/phosphopantothenate--cysteine ligase